MPYYDVNDIKEELTIDDIALLLDSMNAEPRISGNQIVSRTVCHNGDSHKLYYYDDSQTFHCFTKCGESFDVFDLVCKVKDVDLRTAIFYIVNFFNLQHKIEAVENAIVDDDYKILQKWNELLNVKASPEMQKVNLTTIDGAILNNYPQPRILDWEDEHITKEVCDYMNIHYDPENGAILIPHYNEDGQMIGIRQRTLIQEDEKWGKYRPAKIEGKLYNHPLGFNLYGLDKSKDRIKEIGIAIVGESEKFVYQVMNYLGIKNNIAVGMCGSTLSNYQFHLLLEAGAKEICIAIDRDYESIFDENYEKIIKKMERMYQKYSPECRISFMFDNQGITPYKSSPTDSGKELFMHFWNNRIIP